MLCPHCGVNLSDTTMYCPRCGTKLSPSSALVSEDIVDKAELMSNENEQKQQWQNHTNSNLYIPPQMPKKRFYQKTWFIVVCIIFIWPLGLFLMWKYASWNKIVKIIITAIFAIALIGTLFGRNDDKSTNTINQMEAEETTTDGIPTIEIEMKDGFDKLQSFYLQIDDTYTNEMIQRVADENGLYYNEDMGPYSTQMAWVSETKTTGLGPGAEPHYEYSTDSIELFFSRDYEDESNPQEYVYSKDYDAVETGRRVDYTIYDKDLRVYDDNVSGNEAIDKKWDGLEDALKYVLKK